MLIGPKIEGLPGGLVLEELPTTLGSASGAAFEEAIELNPTKAIGRIATLARERGEIGEGFFEGQFPDPFREPPSRVLDVEEANRRFAVGDLKFSEPTPEAVARMKNEFKRDEIRRRDILARGPGGVIGTVVPLGAALVASVLDPLNIASAFVPVVGPARTAALTARLGKTGARLARGAIEGAVGTALLEPLVLAGARAIEADFGIADALLDITFGTVLGGGLHVGVGRLADFIARQKPEVRRAALKTAVAQAAEGRTVDVESVLRAAEEDPFDPRILFREPQQPPPAEFNLGPLTGKGTAARFRDVTGLKPTDIPFIEGVVAELDATRPGQRIFLEVDGQGGTPDVVGFKADTPEFFQSANRNIRREQKRIKRLRRENEKLPDDQKLKIPAMPQIITRAKIRQVAQKLVKGEPLGKAEGDVALEIVGEARGAREENVRQMLDFRQERVAQQEAEIDAIAAREGAPERDAASDFDAADEADRVLERSVDDPSQIDAKVEADELEVQIREDKELSEGKDLDFGEDLVESAESYGRAARAAALCLSRKP